MRDTISDRAAYSHSETTLVSQEWLWLELLWHLQGHYPSFVSGRITKMLVNRMSSEGMHHLEPRWRHHSQSQWGTFRRPKSWIKQVANWRHFWWAWSHPSPTKPHGPTGVCWMNSHYGLSIVRDLSSYSEVTHAIHISIWIFCSSNNTSCVATMRWTLFRFNSTRLQEWSSSLVLSTI